MSDVSDRTRRGGNVSNVITAHDGSTNDETTQAKRPPRRFERLHIPKLLNCEQSSAVPAKIVSIDSRLDAHSRSFLVIGLQSLHTDDFRYQWGKLLPQKETGGYTPRSNDAEVFTRVPCGTRSEKSDLFGLVGLTNQPLYSMVPLIGRIVGVVQNRNGEALALCPHHKQGEGQATYDPIASTDGHRWMETSRIYI